MLAPTNQNRTFPVSRKWQTVSEALQKLENGIYAVKSEGMFPYETYYVPATDEEVDRLHERETAMDKYFCGSSAQREHQSAMTVLSLSEAAAATGLNKTTVLRSIKSGKISGTRDPLGQWQIDAAELHRVYPPVGTQPLQRPIARF